MGWEWRKGRRYWYDAERVGRRVVKRYVGAGHLAELAEQLRALDADQRKWRRIDREVAAARRFQPSRAAKLVAAADRVLAVWLTVAGWQRPNRGPWRRKRGWVVGGELTGLTERKPLDSWVSADLWAANGDIPADLRPTDGKPKAAAVTEYLKGHPAAVALYGDLGRRVVVRLADACAGGDALTAAAIKTKAAALRQELAGTYPNPVELLLAERAVVCWAACHQYELLYYGSLDKSRSVKDHDFHERRMAAAHRRLLTSLKTLAAVRRMKLPDLMAVVEVVNDTGQSYPRAATAEPAG